jgi:hypothetical protein
MKTRFSNLNALTVTAKLTCKALSVTANSTSKALVIFLIKLHIFCSFINHPGLETISLHDASQIGGGAVLMQRADAEQPFHIVSFWSKRWPSTIAKNSVTELETRAIVEPIDGPWRHDRLNAWIWTRPSTWSTAAQEILARRSAMCSELCCVSAYDGATRREQLT